MRDLSRPVAILLFLSLLLCCHACKAADESDVIIISLPSPEAATPTPPSGNSPMPTMATLSTFVPTERPAPSWPLKTFKYKPEGYTTAANVNLREGPGTDYAILRKVGSHAVITMLAESGDWYYVYAAGIEGFISKEFVKVGTLTTPKPSHKYSEDDVYMAAQMIYLEANGGTYEEFQAIATVLANRIASRSFPNTVEENIFSPGQFTVANNREWFLSQKPGKPAIRAASSVLNGGERIFDKGVMYFRAKSLGTEWENRKYFKTIGNHCFFK